MTSDLALALTAADLIEAELPATPAEVADRAARLAVARAALDDVLRALVGIDTARVARLARDALDCAAFGDRESLDLWRDRAGEAAWALRRLGVTCPALEAIRRLRDGDDGAGLPAIDFRKVHPA